MSKLKIALLSFLPAIAALFSFKKDPSASKTQNVVDEIETAAQVVQTVAPNSKAATIAGDVVTVTEAGAAILKERLKQ